MPAEPLSRELRRRLERTIIEAREAAEQGVREALERLAVSRPEPFPELSPEERELRVELRAHARQLGDPLENGQQEIERLVAECAYEHWHRMLFARFLTENHLLIHPDFSVPVTLEECAELAREQGEEDGWRLAGRFAARMLPAVFRPEDPVLRVRLAPEHQQQLEALLEGLPPEVFTSADGLGWVYQFWQSKRKEEVNEAAKAGHKIGAEELPAVTQLFTENYMVRFLLHNTLGAWWAGKVLNERPELALEAESEEELRRACALPGYGGWTYLRFVRDGEKGPWRPAAGTFPDWPKHAAQIKVLDPCCGSGHFLVEALRILVPMRLHEEGLSAREAVDAVLRENLFGLELDERCIQIAAFHLALAAWTYPGTGGYRPLPELNLACSGLAVGAKEEEWLRPAGQDRRLREGMGRLYHLFQDAPTLGSLIDPRRAFREEEMPLIDRGVFEELRPLLAEALEREDVQHDVVVREAGVAAQGMAKAAALLADSYTLVTTNVPYLARGKQADVLKEFCAREHPKGKNDLATVFLERCLAFCARGGTVAIVLPQNWLFLTTYRRFREQLLKGETWHLVARLGSGAFETITGEVVKAILLILSRGAGVHDTCGQLAGLDASEPREPAQKAELLRTGEIKRLEQAKQLENPDARVVIAEEEISRLLSTHTHGVHGFGSKDSPRFFRQFWEMVSPNDDWQLMATTVDFSVHFGGKEQLVFWQNGKGVLAELAKRGLAIPAGSMAWGKWGVAVSQMRVLPCTIHTGEIFDKNVAVILPHDPAHLPAIWCFCSSPEFHEAVRQVDQSLKVTNATLVKVPFDLERWQRVAQEKYPHGLPKPYTNDPTQWIFHGHPCGSVIWDEEEKWTAHGPLRVDETVLQVAVARLLGYRWPAELDPEMELADEQREWVEKCEELLEFADEDGIVCLPPVLGEQPAADRLLKLLMRAYGDAWRPELLDKLLEAVGYRGRTLEDWLRNGFFEQHCRLFHQRPFIWQIWDGRRRDGFSVLVNYHKLDRKRLERLTYTVLGDWIAQQRRAAEEGETGAEARLAAALELQKRLERVLEGEPPYDLFVRWKPLHEQPIGWEPDLNDGVRVNIRPFVEAGVLRKKPNVKWGVDRGKEPKELRPREDFPWFWDGDEFTGKRVNDVHLTNAEKRAARERKRAREEQPHGQDPGSGGG